MNPETQQGITKYDSTNDTFVCQSNEYISFLSRFEDSTIEPLDREALIEAFHNYQPSRESSPILYAFFLSVSIFLVLLYIFYR